MELAEAKTVDELRGLIARLGDRVLFRGQTAHYEKDGVPSIVTSFDRHGCIPPVMLKWSRYAHNLLDTFIGPEAYSQDFSQALLQHYGWRSFYIDCSASAAVSAWFASHRYSDKRMVELSEDYEERPMFLAKRRASYDFEEGTGYLYAISKEAAAKSPGLIDLASIHVADARLRTTAQRAWLLGPLRHQIVPQECLVMQITAPRSVFRDYATAEGFTDTNVLFPTREEDPILDALLSIPWKEVPLRKGGMPGFHRGLDLPEYHDSFRKIASPETAFYRGEMIGDQKIKFPGKVVAVPEIVFFGSSFDEQIPFPSLGKLFEEGVPVAFEIDDLVMHVPSRVAEYQKGIVVSPHGDNLVEVSQLVVEHPGQDLAGAGYDVGWYYRIDDRGYWNREKNEKDCPCGRDVIHERYFRSLKIIEHFLANPKDFA
jgi:hypothetical protein